MFYLCLPMTLDNPSERVIRPPKGSRLRSKTAVLEIGAILVVQVSARAYDGPHTICKNKREKDSKISIGNLTPRKNETQNPYRCGGSKIPNTKLRILPFLVHEAAAHPRVASTVYQKDT